MPQHQNAYRRRQFIGQCGLALSAFGSSTSWAQSSPAPITFPSRPVRIVPFGTAGGPIDTVARLYGERLQARWGQPVIVEAKPGASGIIAADFVAKAPPDGHTVLFTLPLTHVNNAILMPRLPYDPVKDFSPLSMLGTGGPVLVARGNASFNTLKEFVQQSQNHKSLSYGTWGSGSMAHLFGELLRRRTGIDLLHVAYKSEAAVHNDLFGEALDVAWANPATARTHIQAGRMKALGITGSRRVSVLPTLPTFAEQGFTGFDIDSWIGVYAPGRTPGPVVDSWYAALRDITRMSDVKAKLSNFGFEPLGNKPVEFLSQYQSDYPRVAELIRAAGVTAE